MNDVLLPILSNESNNKAIIGLAQEIIYNYFMHNLYDMTSSMFNLQIMYYKSK